MDIDYHKIYVFPAETHSRNEIHLALNNPNIVIFGQESNHKTPKRQGIIVPIQNDYLKYSSDCVKSGLYLKEPFDLNVACHLASCFLFLMIYCFAFSIHSNMFIHDCSLKLITPRNCIILQSECLLHACLNLKQEHYWSLLSWLFELIKCDFPSVSWSIMLPITM